MILHGELSSIRYIIIYWFRLSDLEFKILLGEPSLIQNIIIYSVLSVAFKTEYKWARGTEGGGDTLPRSKMLYKNPNR